MPRPPLPHLCVTMGDPAGIGPEIALKALLDARVRRSCLASLIGSRALLQRVATALSLRMPSAGHLVDSAPAGEHLQQLRPGVVSARAGAAAAAAIEIAIAGCLDGTYDAMVTCPINKLAIAKAGISFPGHTEWLAARCQREGETMMLYHPQLAVALVTCHQSLSSVGGSLTVAGIVRTARALHGALKRLRGSPPRLALLGLNPHAGEGGLFGDEDQLVTQALRRLRRSGLDVSGPLPPDTAFTPDNRRRYDGWVCMYHDQGLIPFKALAFDQGVNVTLGLPLVRTSVDHGTAFDLAWRGVADHESLVQAILLASRLVRGGAPRR